jgi:hypothetical protein
MVDDARHDVGKSMCSRYACGSVSTIDTEMGSMCQAHSSPLLFQIQRPFDADVRVPSFVPWEFMRPHEDTARGNHGFQTLARLSERGGLSLKEALAVVTDRSWGRAMENLSRDEAADQFLGLLHAWETSR